MSVTPRDGGKPSLPRSFLFSLDSDDVPAGLHRVDVPAGSLAVSPDYVSSLATAGASFVILVGYCIDLRSEGAGTREVASTVLQRGLHDGITGILEDSDHFLGRFTAICRLGDGWFVFGDACATRATYYAEHRPLVASHSTLIGDACGVRPRLELFRHYKYGLPGNASPVEGARILPANCALDLDARRVFRFWPRAERVEAPVEELIAEVDSLLIRSADAIARKWTPIVSLTAGLDSRVSLAAFRHIPAKQVFTYDRGERDAIDVRVARRICRRLGIEHHRHVVDEAPQLEVTARVLAMADYRHIKAIAATYATHYDADHLVHVRSNLAEIARGFWHHHDSTKPQQFLPSAWDAALLYRGREHEPGHADAVRYLRDEMERFYELMGYARVDADHPAMHGYDAWDLAYWEHRMATWHAQVLFGSDFALETAIIFNSRRVLALLLAAPFADRADATLLRQFVARRCPELSDIPINPTPWFGNRVMSRVRRAYRTRTRRASPA